MSETEQKACPLYSSEFYTVDFNAHGRLTIKCDGVVIAEQSGHTQADAFLAAYELVHSGVASLRASIAEKDEQLAAAKGEIERLRGLVRDASEVLDDCIPSDACALTYGDIENIQHDLRAAPATPEKTEAP